MSRHDARARVNAVAAIALIALPGAMAAGHPGAPRTAGTTGLTIAVTDGQVAVRPGETLTYRVSLRNTGTATAARLEVTATLSAGLEATSASGNGVLKAGKVSWPAAVPAGGTRTFRVTARVTKPPAQTTRLAAVACATPHGSSRPVVCAAHLDRLPARAATAGAARRPELGVLPYALAALTLLAGGLAAILLRRRRLSRRATAKRTAAAPETPLPPSRTRITANSHSQQHHGAKGQHDAKG